MNDNPNTVNPVEIPSAVTDNPVPSTAYWSPNPWPYPPILPPRTFTTLESVFAWISLAAGYLFCRAFPIGKYPLGGFLLILGLFGVTAILLKRKGAKFGVMPLAVAASAVVVSSALIFCGNAFLQGVAYTYALMAYGYFLYAATGNRVQGGFSDFIAVDFFKALFVMPFVSMYHLFRALFSGKAKGSGKVLLRLLLGAALTVIPTTIVLVLLSYDSGFSSLIGSIFDIGWGDIFSHIFSLGFAISIGMYIFGLFISSVDHEYKDVMTVERCRKTSQRIKIAPTTTVLTAVLPLIVIYVIFFISQWQYYISGFTGVLPQNLSYAEYAREGFFQLCTISVINLLVLIMVALFMRRSADRPSVLFKGIALVFAVFTLVLISTALSKMAMYIGSYGLTQKRVYATWMMGVLAIVFILIAVKQFVPKLRLVAASMVICVVCFAGLSVANVDGIIASHNVDRFLDGRTDVIDLGAMDMLGDAAIPEVIRLAEAMEESGVTYKNNAVYDGLIDHLKREALRIERKKEDFFSITIPAYKAEHALREAGFLE